MIFGIASMPHSGTNWCIDTFGAGMRTERPAINTKPSSDNNMMVYHIWAEHYPTIRWWARNWPVIVPQRHPLRCAESYIVRSEPVTDLIDNWRRVIDLANNCEKTLLLPLDNDQRESRFQAIESALGKKFDKHWRPINSIGVTTQIVGNNLVMMEDFMEEQREFFTDLGYT